MTWNRREFTGGTLALLASRAVRSQHPKSMKISLWIGSCNSDGSKDGIYHSWFDAVAGAMSQPKLAAETAQPSFFCTMRDGKRRTILYTANELVDTGGGLSSFVMDPVKGELTLLNKAPGDSPCFVSARPATRTIYAANYISSSIMVYHAAVDGSLSGPIQRIDLADPRFGPHGPHRRQNASHPHSTMLSPDGKFLIVNDLGDDSIDIFRILPDGKLDDQKPVLVKRTPSSGPRHLAFHPNGHWVYGINELNNLLQRYEWSERGGSVELKPLEQSISSMAPGAAPNARVITASEVAISPDGRFLYACTRGDDSLTVFDIDSKTGDLTYKQRVGSGGKVPRQFTLDPTGGWIVCCNNGSPAVTLFRRNKVNGTLSEVVQTLAVDSPEFALFT